MNIDETNVEQNEINKIDEPATSQEEVNPVENKNEEAPPEQDQSAKEVDEKEQSTPETTKEQNLDNSDDDSANPSYQSKINEIFIKLREKLEKNDPIDVLVKSRIKGGFRVVYEDIPMFLPASHFSLKKTPTEAELQDAVGTIQKVLVHELQEFDEGRKAVIVTKKPLLREEFYANLKEGDKVKGIVSSIASFGVFIDLGGIEGLIHISRLSQVHVEDPSTMFNKGDEIEAIISKIDQENDRIGLSRKELEDSPWKGVSEEFAPGSQHKGIVRRLTDFGAYVELKPGVDGLLRTPEISWTKRIKKPSDIFSPNQEILIEVLNVSEEKGTVALSYKKTQPNPWLEMKAKYPIKTQVKGVVSQVMPQGLIATINNEVDGFMPRSKMKDILHGKKIPYQVNDELDVIIADLIPEDESLILAPVIDEETLEASRQKRFSSKRPAMDTAKSQGGITLLDMITDSEKKNLIKSVND